jgi:hypothetical protein
LTRSAKETTLFEVVRIMLHTLGRFEYRYPFMIQRRCCPRKGTTALPVHLTGKNSRTNLEADGILKPIKEDLLVSADTESARIPAFTFALSTSKGIKPFRSFASSLRDSIQHKI